MSASPKPRGSSRGPPQRPSTPDHSRPTITRTASCSVAPKSEYLRNALQARRAQNTPTPSPLEMRPPPPPAPKLAEFRPPSTSPDAFAEFTLTEEHTAPVSPIRRRRPSDSGPPRSKTNRELTNEIEKLKDSLMTSNMRVELLKKNSSELQHDLTRAREQAERVEPLEQENYDLHDENTQLMVKLEKMEDEIARLRDANDVIRKNNESIQKVNDELSAIASESAAQWQGQEIAITEAVDCIVKLEEEKAALSVELRELRDRVTALENTSPTSTLVDGSRHPSRVYSVDESRPSTSHFDSDYYSQPASPQVKPSTESVLSVTPSERSKKFIEQSEERRQSTRDLVKRMSVASLRALSMRSPSPPPDVPQIPEIFQQPVPQTVRDELSQPAKPTPKTPGRYRKSLMADTLSLLDAPKMSPVRPAIVQQSPARHPDGLRGLYRPDRTTRGHISTEARRPSIQIASLPNTAGFANRQIQVAETSPRVPSRDSSKHAHTSSSSEQLQRRSTRHRRQSESDMISSSDIPTPRPDNVSSEWATLAPVPSISVFSETDLTSELDPQELNSDWWRGIDKLTLSQNVAQTQRAHRLPVQGSSPSKSSARSRPGKLAVGGVTAEGSRKGMIRSITSPTMPRHEPPRNFLFNPVESDDEFIEKTKVMDGRGRR